MKYFLGLLFFLFCVLNSNAANIRIIRPVHKVLYTPGAVALATDNFNRANETPLGGNWTLSGAGDNDFNLSANHIVPANTSVDSVDWYNAVVWPNNQYSKASIVAPGTSAGGQGMGLCVRHATSLRTYYGCVIDAAGASNVQLFKMVAGTKTVIWTRTATYSSGAIMELQVQGTTLRVIYNGSQVGADATDSAISTGNAGLYYSSTDASATLDNWEGGSLP
jgi:hypothetical protein